MRIVVALGGNALRRPSDPPTTVVQRYCSRAVAEAIAPLVHDHEVIVLHGNGPQVGVPALHVGSNDGTGPYPLDVLDAGTQGMVGYLIQQELRSILSPDLSVVTVLTMITVDPEDPAFAAPATFVGPGCSWDEADVLAREHGWTFRQDGARWRRVVPSPEPQKIVELAPISWLVELGAVVVCAGGGAIPVVRSASGDLTGVEAVIDKDVAGELLAEDVGADLYVMATDVDGVYVDWGMPTQWRLGEVTPADLAGHEFAAGSMSPKVDAAARFVAKTGRRAAIGALDDVGGIVAGRAGTSVVPASPHNARRP
ncbi:carbamate kinase [Pseudonocardia zijingensis]|jgi:carbamate kinase|uniref:Carbamate kinase n=1 Tax=Pseudonocardia zijingensis TaxID=153376 RepID=A0ABN1Q329_9PSEU